MPRPRRFAAVAGARISRAAVRRIVRRGGSALPGLVAATIDPDLIYSLIGDLGGGTVLVSGTNGKTTVTALVAQIARAAGDPVVSNPSGSNLARGLLSHLLELVDLRGRPRWPHDSLGVLELDEAQLIASLARIKPRAGGAHQPFQGPARPLRRTGCAGPGIRRRAGRLRTAAVAGN